MIELTKRAGDYPLSPLVPPTPMDFRHTRKRVWQRIRRLRGVEIGAAFLAGRHLRCGAGHFGFVIAPGSTRHLRCGAGLFSCEVA